MTQVDVQDAGAQLGDLLVRSERGEEIVIARAGRPVARLVPIAEVLPGRFGVMDLEVPDDFDAALVKDELAAWEQGRAETSTNR